MPRRVLKSLLALALAGSIVAAGYVESVAVRASRLITLPAAGGTYEVGRTVNWWVDPTRTDPLAPKRGRRRELAVWLWYPAVASGPRAQYMPGPWSDQQLPGETEFDAVRVRSVESAPVAAGRFPLVVLQPGLGLTVPQYTAIAENLAAHGYVVAGVNPTYSASITVLSSRILKATPAGDPAVFDGDDLHTPTVEAVAADLLAVWAADARYTAARVATPDETNVLTGHVDATRTAYIGHSFGGAAALQACHDDPNCVAAADLDGTQFGPVVHSGLRQPLLILASDSCVTGDCSPVTAGDRSDQATARALLAASTGRAETHRIDGLRHFDFTDYNAFFVAGPLRSALGLGSLPRDYGLMIANGYLVAFLDYAVRS